MTLIKKDDYQSEYKLVQYVEVDAAEKGILSGNFSHDGRLWLVEMYNIKPAVAPVKHNEKRNPLLLIYSYVEGRKIFEKIFNF